MTVSDHDEHTMRIRRGGCDVEGRWRLAGDEVQVECAYGADRARFDGSPPVRVAELLLARLAFAAMSLERRGRLEPLMV